MTLSTIQGLWVGSNLPTMQKLSIASFLANGHEYHLYTYTDFPDLPPGAVLRDAREIIPEKEVFRNSKHHTYAAFSDYFRYRLLLMKGGWWADTDIICLRPFDIADDYVFSSEHELCIERINSGVIKTPAKAEVMQYAWDTCSSKDRDNLSWDEVGPDLVEEAVKRYSLEKYVKPAITFCALPSDLWRSVVEPVHRFRFQKNTLAIHLWHEIWRARGWNVDLSYAPDCLYEQLKSTFLSRTANQARYRYQLL